MRKKLPSPLAQRGFTFIEVLVVVTIIAVLSAVGLVSYRQASVGARDAKRKADLQSVRQALILYRSQNGVYPPPYGGSSATSPANFSTMIGTLATQGYLVSNDFVDPRNGSDNFAYRYYSESPGNSFTLCAKLEQVVASPPSNCSSIQSPTPNCYCANSP